MLSPGSDVQVQLPIDDIGNDEYRRLFNQFFSVNFDQVLLIFRPQRRDPMFKQVMYRHALRSPVYCLTLIAQAHMANIKDAPATTDSVADQLTDRIYAQLLQMMREKIESFDLDDVDTLLLAIVALCEYDLKLNRYDALRSHHSGMSALVSKRGGVHNLGTSLPYVLRMDRFLAIRANAYPQFAPTELPPPNLTLRYSNDDYIRGASFQSDLSGLSEPVVALCSDAAQLFDLMDELNIQFDPTSAPASYGPKLEYFVFLREDIDTRHAILNHQSTITASTVNKDLLALTAMKILTYHVALGNYLPIVNDLLSTRLWNMLTKAPLSSPRSQHSQTTLDDSGRDQSHIPTIDLSDWTEDMPMLLWILFACALPSSREASLSFTAHLRSLKPSTVPLSTEISTSSGGRNTSTIVSPSSPRRHRYLPSFILHVAEHLIGERPLSGTSDWDRRVVEILESFLWHGARLSAEMGRIVKRVHENVLIRAEDDI